MARKKRMFLYMMSSVAVLLAVLTSACGAGVESQEGAASGSAALAQTIPQFVSELRAEGLAVKDGGTIPGDPKGLYVALQATTQYGGAADFVGFQTTLRQAIIAKSRGLQIDSIKVETFSPSGAMISGQQIPLSDSHWAIDPKWSSEPGLSDSEIATNVQQAVTTNAVSIDRIQVTKDPAGYRTVALHAVADDNAKLAASLNDIRVGIAQTVKHLNGENAALIALVVLDIDSPTANPLHRSWLDWQLQMEGNWTDPAVQALLPDGGLIPVGPGV